MKRQTDSLQQKLNDQIYENNKLRAQLKGKFSESQTNHSGTSVNTKFSKPSTSGTKLYSVTPFPNSKVLPKVVEKNDLSKADTSHLTTKKIIEKCTKVLSPGIVSLFLLEAEYVAAANCCGQALKIHTDANVADLLTKAFDGPRFLHLVVHIGMLNP
ncbi:hypothetical protein Tco_0825278 [Tanacetum coccineum]